MRHHAVFLTLIGPALAFPAERDPLPEAAGEMTIYTQFAHLPEAISVENMKTELDSIMSPLGIRFDWRSMDQATGNQVTAQLMVFNFQGQCKADWPTPIPSRSGPLGWTHISEGEILPFAGVDCDRIREVLTQPLAEASTLQRARMMGRGMARVVAHEMYHFLMNTTKHASTGIAKPSYNAGELASEYLRFDDRHLLLMRQEMQRPFRSRANHAAGTAGE